MGTLGNVFRSELLLSELGENCSCPCLLKRIPPRKKTHGKVCFQSRGWRAVSAALSQGWRAVSAALSQGKGS